MLDDRHYMRPEYGHSGSSRPRSPSKTLLIINVVVFVLELIFIDENKASLNRFYDFFALSGMGMAHGYVWQLFTYQFLHGGLGHLIFNCLALYFAGRQLEDHLGRRQFLLVYFGSGVIGGLAQIIIGSALGAANASVVGASGCLMGLLGALCWQYWNVRIQLMLMLVLPITVTGRIGFIALVVMDGVGAFSSTSNLAHFAHLGGLITGLVYMRSARGLAFTQLPGIRTLWSFLRSPRVKVRFSKSPENQPPSRFESGSAKPKTSADFMASEVDPILDKISAHGIHSLTAEERAILEKAQKNISKR